MIRDLKPPSIQGFRFFSRRKGELMKYIVVLSFDVDNIEDVGKTLKKIDPPSIPGFSGEARVAIDPVATRIEEWLDE